MLNKEGLLEMLSNKLYQEKSDLKVVEYLSMHNKETVSVGVKNIKTKKMYLVRAIKQDNCIQILRYNTNDKGNTVKHLMKALPIKKGEPVHLNIEKDVAKILIHSCNEMKASGQVGIGIYKVTLPEGFEQICDTGLERNNMVEIDFPSTLNFLGNCAVAHNNIKKATFKRGKEAVVVEDMALLRNGLKVIDLSGVKKIGYSALDENELEIMFYSNTISSFFLEQSALSNNGVQIVLEDGCDCENLLNNLKFCTTEESVCDLELKSVSLVISQKDKKAFKEAYEEVNIDNSMNFCAIEYIEDTKAYFNEVSENILQEEYVNIG